MIYLDNSATTRPCPEAVEAMTKALTENWGNPSALYDFGIRAARELRTARHAVAAAMGAEPDRVFFTSGGTEADNWAVFGTAKRMGKRGKHIVTTAIEHAAVLEPIRELEEQGYEVTRLRPDRTGHIDPEELSAALRPDTVLVSVMLVNNELGTIQPVKAAAEAIRRTQCPALLHTDAVQGFLKVPFTPRGLGADLVTISGHKVRAPKGIGALYIKKERISKWKPLLPGGGQEGGLRSGTEPTAQIAALAAACRAWGGEKAIRHIADVKEYALERLRAQVEDLRVISAGDAPHICAVSLPGYPSEMLVRDLSDRGICVSSGSACHRGKPSHVFAALGLSKQELMGVLRVSFGPDSTRRDAEALADALAEIQKNRIAVR